MTSKGKEFALDASQPGLVVNSESEKTLARAGWSGELAQLQTATTRLLAAVRADPSERRARRRQERRAEREQAAAIAAEEGGGAPRRRRRKRRPRPGGGAESTAAQAAATAPLGGRATLAASASLPTMVLHGSGGLRETVEVMDAGSGQASARSARSDDDDAAAAADTLGKRSRSAGPSAAKLQQAQHSAAEAPLRSLAFADEAARVTEGAPSVVPRDPSLTLQELDAKRSRLRAIETARYAAIEAQSRATREAHLRAQWSETMVAAEHIQRAARGMMGRRFLALRAEAEALEADVRAQWIEVRDRQSGDVWYHNTVTDESQWELPEALGGRVPAPRSTAAELPTAAEREAAALPAIDDARAAKRRKRAEQQQQKEARLQQQHSLPDIGDSEARIFDREDEVTGGAFAVRADDEAAEAEAAAAAAARAAAAAADDDEPNEASTFDKADTKRLFLPDGTPNVQLSTMVRDALNTSKFDSVATLLQSKGGLAEGVAAVERAGQPPGAGDGRPTLFPDVAAPKPMVARSKMGRKKGSARQRALAAARGAGDGLSPAEQKSLALTQVAHPGFDLGDGAASAVPGAFADPQAMAGGGEAMSAAAGGAPTDASVRAVREICFNCWSSGKGRFCVLHKAGAASKPVSSSESSLVCKNWDIGVLRRRYRSEEIQEIFMKSASSLRYDKARKKFVTCVEQKHPVYRALGALLAKFNFTARRKMHQLNWLRSFVEQLRCGGMDEDGNEKSGGAMLRLRNTLANKRWVRHYADTVCHLHPKPPITGTSLPERRGVAKHIVKKGKHTYIMALPNSEPVSLYLPRPYELLPPRSIPMPEPGAKTVAKAPSAPNAFIPEAHAAAWFERFMARTARDAITNAVTQVVAVTPLPGVELLRRTKYPMPHSIKFATFSRKPAGRDNLAVGGLCAELTVSQLVQTVIPPQYGDLVTMEKVSIAPDVSAEVTARFSTLPLPPVDQLYVARLLQHPLNGRRAPTVMVAAGCEASNRFYYGENRPEQTGEEASHGFRTSCNAAESHHVIETETSVQTFVPSAEITTPNLPAANSSVTTHVDHTYPFCEPSNRNNTTLDFYHLMLLGSHAPNKAQVFTNLGLQESGKFMVGCDAGLAMGHCVSMVYRSWAFVQRHMIEEYLTDDSPGVRYWYDRRTGETFWERPLAPEEKVAIKEGGTVIDGLADHSVPATDGDVARYSQPDVRKLILKPRETADQMRDRRKGASQAARWSGDRQGSSGQFDDGGGGQDHGGHQSPVRQGGAEFMQMPALGQTGGGGGGGGMASSGHPTPNRSAAASMSGGQFPGSQPGSRPRTGDRQARFEGQDQQQGGGLQRVASFAPSAGGQSYQSSAQSHGGGHQDPMEGMMQQLSAALGPAMQGGQINADALVQLGVGIGLSLQRANGVDVDRGERSPGGSPERPMTGMSGMTGMSEPLDDLAMPGVLPFGTVTSAPPMQGGFPIGSANPTIDLGEATELDHNAESAQHARAMSQSAQLTTEEKFQGIEVVAPSAPPDEATEDAGNQFKTLEDEIRDEVPVYMYPQGTRDVKDFATHDLAGVGEGFVREGEGDAQRFVETGLNGALLRRSADPLPEGFFAAIHTTHTASATVDYLPSVPNLPQTRPVGRVKPRSVAEDWKAIGFDPWSAGKDPLTTEFIPTLVQTDLGDGDGGGANAAEGAFIDLVDREGLAEQQEVATQSNKMASDFALLASWVRNNHYSKIEEAMNQADWSLPIDYQDELGNTLLHIGGQNCNKRVIKLCLRRGADINKQNLNGQGVLHFAYAYGFDDLATYCIQKGADDSLRNADGLTCYEGLSMAEVEGI